MAGQPFERLSYDREYDQGLSYLYNLQKFGIKFGLSKTENLLKVFNNPQESLRLIHIAGSNGKGSVAAMLSSVYSQAGYKVGLFTSPHLIDFRERFQINGRLIEKDQTLALIKEIKEKTDLEEPPTFFEFVTAMALLYFYREKVDLAIMETGLGGRLDATNIIHPLITVITTITLEHQEYLGKTLKKIALEKAGIIKPHIPLVTGVNQKKVQVILEDICREKQVLMLLVGRDFRTRKLKNGTFSYFGFRSSEFGVGEQFGVGEKGPFVVRRSSFVEGSKVTLGTEKNFPNMEFGILNHNGKSSKAERPTLNGFLNPQSAIRNPKFPGDLVLTAPNSELKTPNFPPSPVTRHPSLRVGLLGDHQIRNAGLALTVIDYLKARFPIQEEAVREGLARVTWPGRLEVLSERPWIVLDGAHNPGAMKTLSRTLSRVFSYKRLLLIIGMMKDKAIEQTFNYIIPKADIVYLSRAEYDRSSEPETLLPLVKVKNLPCHLAQSIPLAINQARKEAEPEDLILITGSLFLVGEARAWWERERCKMQDSRFKVRSPRAS
ncbi:MAG: bifunctional folylpolyglutamate synthase/dihydrofolate synthase [Deltaproteobacteria bacterium]|nr:bifunctional folylpolyglutamate synthase/dihydrofolate synthase [Deltaproteobacteria bacterium]